MKSVVPKILTCPIVLLACALANAEQLVTASPGDWPWWRGPNHNGTANCKAPIEWNAAKNVVWKTAIPGRGHASPTVFGNRIFLATADESAETQSVVCFDRKTGARKWQTIVSKGGFPKIHRKNTHASQTIACDGERLYVTFFANSSIVLAAFDLNGKQQWRKVISPFNPRRYKYGYASSPLLYKSYVIVLGDCDSGGFFTAFDRRSGTVAWRATRPAQLSWSSPIVAKLAGRDQLLLSGCDLVTSYDPNTGRELWKTPATTAATCGTMVWDGDLVFASGGYPKAETVCIQADGSGRIVWKNNQKCYEQSLLAHDGYIYAVTDKGIAYCWKAENGQEMWSVRLRGPISASPLLAGGLIYAANEAGTIYVYRANPEKFELLAQNRLGSELFATPAICGGQIFLRVAFQNDSGRQEFLYCVGNDS